eukprot:2909515-Rhodomonas_salina.1
MRATVTAVMTPSSGTGSASGVSREPSLSAAASRIQRVWRNLIANTYRLDRKNLIERLELERKVWLVCRLFLLHAVLFGLLMQSMRLEVDPDAHRDLHRAYERTLNLPSVADITTSDELRRFLMDMSLSSRRMQVQSSEYFSADAAQTIFGGLQVFKETLILEVDGLKARVSSASFTFTAWVDIGSSDGGYVVRKPMASTGLDAALSCWGLHVGETTRFDFGAHDYGGIDRGQESVLSSAATPRELHMQTVVVNQTHIAFYVNAQLTDAVSLSRPITDCAMESLEVGDVGMSIGEVVFYPKALSQSKIEEIYIGGMTLEAIASGLSLFWPQATSFDAAKSYNKLRFNENSLDAEIIAEEREMSDVVQLGIIANLENPRPEPGSDLPDIALSEGCIDPD